MQSEVYPVDTKKRSPIFNNKHFTGEEGPVNSKDAGKELSSVQHLRMTTLKIVPPLVPIITIGSSNTSTKGNVTVISGEGKSGKTAFLSALMAGAITQSDYYDGFNNLNVSLNKASLAVMHFETEQSESRHQENHRKSIQRAGLTETPDYFFSYNIRRNAIAEYTELVETACRGARLKCGGIFIIVIDGTADFISDVNDAAEANAHVKWLEEISIEFDCPVIVVVHVNPGSDKERGHLGSQLQRKCESLLLIKRKDDISTVEAKLLRNAGISDTPQIQFQYDKMKGHHVSCDEAPNLAVVNKDLLRLTEMKTIANVVFKNKVQYSYQDAVTEIMKTSKKSISIAKNMFTEMKVHEVIVQGEDKKWMLDLQPV